MNTVDLFIYMLYEFLSIMFQRFPYRGLIHLLLDLLLDLYVACIGTTLNGMSNFNFLTLFFVTHRNTKSSLVAQRVNDPALLLLWLRRSLPWHRFDAWPRNFHMPQAQPKKKRKFSSYLTYLFFIKATPLYQFTRVALMKYCKLGHLNYRDLFSHCSGGQKSKSKVSAGLVSPVSSFLGLLWPPTCRAHTSTV